ncbi:MAG TPA: flavin reductase family protein [Phycisphaerales bacterium]|nr:flavin reductase family protein [Phycisphaerales bacterium]
MDIDPLSLDIADRYKLLIGAIVPRPIAFVSTSSRDGRLNLAPFSFFNGVSSNPPTILFCPANKPDGTQKDTLINCSEAPDGLGQFVVNIVSEAIARRMSICAEEIPYGESEFALSGLTPAPSKKVRPPRVAESLFSMECITDRILRLNPGAPAGGNIVIGRIVHIHAADGLVNDRWHVDPAKLAAVGRMAGLGYCTTRDRFEIPWGKAALDAPNEPRA